MHLDNQPRSHREWIGDGDQAIYRTLDVMNAVLARSAADFSVLGAAWEIIGHDAPPGTVLARVERVFRFVSTRLRYTYDPPGLEWFKTPAAALREISLVGTFAGDCDDAAVLLAALLRGVGVPTRFVVMSQRADGDLHHIYVEAAVGGRWLALDPIVPATAIGTGFGGRIDATRRLTR